MAATNWKVPTAEGLTRLFGQAASEVEATTTDLGDEDARKTALSIAKHLVDVLEKPEDVVMRYAWEVLQEHQSGRYQSDGKATSGRDIAKICKAEEDLVVRIMRVVTAIRFAAEVGPQSYVATSLTKAMTKPSLEAAVKICHDNSARIQMRMHEYFRANGYVSPTDSSDCAFQWTFSTKMPYFEHIHSNAEFMKDFNVFMAGNRVDRKHWIDWYPVQEEIFAGASNDADSVIMVDVGDSKGHDLQRFLNKHPASKGRLVLQDLPHVLDYVRGLDEDMKIMPHDFFAPQPIRGARVYYTHYVLHNWPDDKCRLILSNLRDAMTPGYSKILLDESILPDVGSPSFLAAGDINMMSIMAGKKRSRQQWLELLQSVGLEKVRIWKSPNDGDDEGIIEVMLDAES